MLVLYIGSCDVLMTGAMEWSQSLSRDPVSIICIQFTADPDTVIAGSADGSISVCILQWSQQQFQVLCVNMQLINFVSLDK